MVRQIRSQFWVGSFASESLFWDFFGEDQSIYERDDCDDLPVSRIAESQGEIWIDHDFAESGFQTSDAPIAEKFAPHSWSEFWAPLVEREMLKKSIGPINAFMMVGVDEPPGKPPYRKISNPRDVEGEGFKLFYLGELVHDDYPISAGQTPIP